MYEFIESSVFAKYVYDYLTEEEYAGLQWYLSSHPDAGDVTLHRVVAASFAGAHGTRASVAAYA